MDILQGLPSGFGKDPYFGLGIKYEFRYLINAIEELDGVTDLRIKPSRAGDLPRVEGSSYIISVGQFDDACKAIIRFHDKALSIAGDDKRAFVHNALLTPIDPKKFPEKHRPYRKDAIAEPFGKSVARTITISKTDREAVVAAATTAVKSVRKSDPKLSWN